MGGDRSDGYEHITDRGWSVQVYTPAQYHARFASRRTIDTGPAHLSRLPSGCGVHRQGERR